MISQQIKDKLDIIEVIGDYIKLKKSGANYTSLCPFHQEKTPSFFVSPSKQIWHCFGACSEGGDIFKFVMKIEGIEYIDALRILANKAGIQLKKPDKETILRESEKEILYNICELSSLFFEKQLESSKGKIVLNYLLERKVDQTSIKKWKIGYGSDAWQGLFDFLINKRYKIEDIEKAGLIIKKEAGGYFDRFRQRIIFPIFDLNSRIIGFSGRICDNDNSQTAKYINSPTTILYDKSKTLYGLDQAKIEIRKKDYCILVEGYFDVILLSQSGFKNVISISGTALTIDHLRIIGRYTKNLYFCFDTDLAGESATKKSIEMALMEDFNIKIVILPEGLDPSDIIEKSLDFQKYIDNAKPIIAYYFDRAFKNFNTREELKELKIEDKKEISRKLLPVIKKISNKIEQSHWLQELSNRLNIKEAVLIQEMEKIKNFQDVEDEKFFNFSNSNKQPLKNKKELLEERIIILVLLFNEFADIVDTTINLDATVYSDFFTEIIKLIKEEKKIAIIQEKISKGSDLDFFNYLLIKVENSLIEKDDAEEEIKLCLKEIKKIKLKEKREEIIKKIKETEQQKSSKNKQEVEKLLGELKGLN